METLEIKIQVQTDTDQLQSAIEKILLIRQEFLKDCISSQVTVKVRSCNEQNILLQNTSGLRSSIAERF